MLTFNPKRAAPQPLTPASPVDLRPILAAARAKRTLPVASTALPPEALAFAQLLERQAGLDRAAE